MKRLCEECKSQNLKSKVFQGASTTTLGLSIHYWDEDGKEHTPQDVNTTTTQYRCSNGHTWGEAE